MFKVHALQAAFGDSLILEFGTPSQKRFVLIDGGPDGVYAAVLRNQLAQIQTAGGRLERVILSHVDGDHIVGLLSLFSELRANQAPIAVDALWHNSFAKTIDDGPNNIASRIHTMLSNVAGANMVMGATTDEINTIPQGNKLRQDALVLGIPFNDGVTGDLVSLDTSPGPLTWGNLTVTVVGPTKVNLDNLKEDWLEWLETHEGPLSTGDPFLAAMADQSKPNLSSIMLHVKDDTGKTALFTGDGRGDHLLQGLGQANLLSATGTLHVNLFKLPHHGSDRNVTKTFFKKVTADEYIASANGKDGNPDYSTLSWLITAAKDQNRQITIHVTNSTKSTDDIQADFDPQTFGYTLKVRPANQPALTLLLS
jgi:beta-lactamase superfamily II metal-dependent hydrolase